jgi:hypothetical protein
MEVYCAISEARKDNIPTILRDGRANTGLQKLLDSGDGILVLGVVGALLTIVGCWLGARQPAGQEMLHDRAKDHRLQVLPLDITLGHRDEIGPKENAIDPIELKNACGQRRADSLRLRAIVGGTF